MKPETIIRAVCEAAGLTRDELCRPPCGPVRKVSDARAVAAVMLMAHCGLLWGGMAMILGGHRSSQLKAYRRAGDLYTHDQPFRRLFDRANDGMYRHVL